MSNLRQGEIRVAMKWGNSHLFQYRHRGEHTLTIGPINDTMLISYVPSVFNTPKLAEQTQFILRQKKLNLRFALGLNI